MPDDTPVTVPVDEPIVAMPVPPLLHVPLAVASFNVVVKPAQTVTVPVMDDGNGLTVTTIVAMHPVPRV